MDVYVFLKERIELIRHFYDAASAPFVDTKRCIEGSLPPYDNPPYDESGEPAFLVEWLRADVEHELVGRSAVSMLSDALKQAFVNWEQKTWAEQPCADCFKKAFKSGFVAGYVACFTEGFDLDWSSCPADLDVLKQVVLARNSAQHADLVLDHLSHDEKSLRSHPRPFFVRPEDEGANASLSPFLSPTIHISKEKLYEAIEHVDRLGIWLQQEIDRRRYRRWSRPKAC
nr:hypothetical protein [Variovorax boronicumulans]